MPAPAHPASKSGRPRPSGRHRRANALEGAAPPPTGHTGGCWVLSRTLWPDGTCGGQQERVTHRPVGRGPETGPGPQLHARPARLGASRRPQASGAHASDLGPAPAPPAQPTPTPGPRAAQPSRRTGLTRKLAGSSNSARARCPGGPWKLPPAWVQPEQASRTLLQVGPRSSASAHLR